MEKGHLRGGDLLEVQRDPQVVLVLQDARVRRVEHIAALDAADQQQETAELPRPCRQLQPIGGGERPSEAF